MSIFDGLRKTIDELEKDATDWKKTWAGFKKDLVEVVDVVAEEAAKAVVDFDAVLKKAEKSAPRNCPKCQKFMAFTEVKETDSEGVTVRSGVYKCEPCNYRLDVTHTTTVKK